MSLLDFSPKLGYKISFSFANEKSSLIRQRRAPMPGLTSSCEFPCYSLILAPFSHNFLCSLSVASSRLRHQFETFGSGEELFCIAAW